MFIGLVSALVASRAPFSGFKVYYLLNTSVVALKRAGVCASLFGMFQDSYLYFM